MCGVCSYPALLSYTMLFITTLYACFGLFGYAAFADATFSNILLNLGDTAFIVVVKVCM